MMRDSLCTPTRTLTRTHANEIQTDAKRIIFVSSCDSVTIVVGYVGAILIAERMMWLQYVADMDTEDGQNEGASVRASLRRMSRTFIVVDNTNSESIAVVPAETKSDEENTRSPHANDNADDDVRSKENKVWLSSALLSMSNTIVVVFATLGYPLAALPYYRAASTTEWVIFASYEFGVLDSDECARDTNEFSPPLRMAELNAAGSALRSFAWSTLSYKSSFSQFRGR